jgi:hypothetical protein
MLISRSSLSYHMRFTTPIHNTNLKLYPISPMLHLSHHPHDPTPLKNLCTDLDNLRHTRDSSARHITSHHITSHHITSHHITSHHITPRSPSPTNPPTVSSAPKPIDTDLHLPAQQHAHTHLPSASAPIYAAQTRTTTSAEPTQRDKSRCILTCTGRIDRDPGAEAPIVKNPNAR